MKELLFNGCYREWLENETKTTTIREGRRDGSHPRGYEPGEIALVRCMFEEGVNELKFPVIITSVVVKKIGELNYHDLAGESPDCSSKDAVKCVLGMIYKRIFTDEDVVTVIKFEYL